MVFHSSGDSSEVRKPIRRRMTRYNRQTRRCLSVVANQLSAPVGENLPERATISLNLSSAAQRPCPQGWIPPLRAVSCTDTQTTGAQFPPPAVRLPTHESALVPGASCVDRGSSLVMNVPQKAVS